MAMPVSENRSRINPILFSLTLITLLFPALVSAASPAAAAPQQQQNEATNAKRIQVLAVVNGETINRQQVANECMRRFGNEVLESLINKMLVFDECQRLGITITERDVNDDLANRVKRLGSAWTTEQYVKFYCEKKNISVDRLKRDIIWSELALRRLAQSQTQVSPQEIDERLEFEFGPQVQVRQLVVDSRETANQIHQQATADPASFERLCKKYSVDINSAAQGGLLPPIRVNTGFPEFENMAFSLNVGDFSPVFEVEKQFFIMKCLQKTPAMQLGELELTAAKERIEAEISQSKLREVALTLFEKMQQNSKIVNVINDPALRQQMPGVAATVNGKQVQQKQVSEECITRFGKTMLAVLIRNKLLEQSLQQAGRSMSEEQTQMLIDDEIARVAEERGFVANGQPQVEAFLNHVTEGEPAKIQFYIEDEVWPSVAMKELVKDSVQVTEEDMQKSFEANYGPRVEVRAMMFNDQRQAFKIWKMASDNPTEEFFGQLAYQYSVEPMSKNNYGHIPPVQKYSGRPTLEQEAFNLKPNEISKVIQLGDFWTFVYCRGRTEPKVTNIEDVREYIYKDVLARKTYAEMEVAKNQMFARAQIDNYLTGTSQPGEAAVQRAREDENLR